MARDVQKPSRPPYSLNGYAITAGVIISCVLAIAIVIAGLKAGITPGVSPLVVLIAWAIFHRVLRQSDAVLALNLAQVAGSAGVAVTAGIIFTAPLLPILSASQGLAYDGLPLGKLTLASLAGALIGFGYVGLNARKILADGRLPAPEARACEAMVRVATGQFSSSAQTTDDDSSADQRGVTTPPSLIRTLIPGLLHGVGAPWLVAMGFAASTVEWIPKRLANVQLQVPYMPIYFGIGGLLPLGTAMATFIGTIMHLVCDYGLRTHGTPTGMWPTTSLRWIGGGAMTIAVIWNLVSLSYRSLRTNGNKEDEHVAFMPEMLHVSVRARRALLLNVLLGSLVLLGLILVLGGWNLFSVSLAMTVTILAAFMVALGAFLSLQIGSSTSPVSGAVFLMTLVLCGVGLLAGRGHHSADLELMTLVLVAACVAVCTSNDTSQDYRTLQLCGVPIARGFFAHWLGVISAALIVPFAVVVAEQSYGLGSPSLPAPQGQLFATVVEGILFDHQIPWGPVLVGFAIGIAAVAVEAMSKARGITVPSMALAIGLYLPPMLGVGLLMGALARYAGDRGKTERSASILIAGGLITGAALFDVIVGMGLFAGMPPLQSIRSFSPILANGVAIVGISLILLLIYRGAKGHNA